MRFPRKKRSRAVIALVLAAVGLTGYTLKQRRDWFRARGDYYTMKLKFSTLMLEAYQGALDGSEAKLVQYQDRLMAMENVVRTSRQGSEQSVRSLAPSRIDVRKGRAELEEAYQRMTKFRTQVDFYENLKRLYDYAASHPWVRLPPDPPEPEPLSATEP